MREVAIKNLYRNLSKELYDIPFAITKDGVIVGYVVKECLDKPIEISLSGLDKKAKGLDKPAKTINSGLDNIKKESNGLDHRSKWKIEHPRDWCSVCCSYNKDCVC